MVETRQQAIKNLKKSLTDRTKPKKLNNKVTQVKGKVHSTVKSGKVMQPQVGKGGNDNNAIAFIPLNVGQGANAMELNGLLNSDVSPINSLVITESDTATLEERKKALRDNIAKLQQQVAAEEDEELKELMELESSLKRKLSSTDSGSGNTNKDKRNKVKEKNSFRNSDKAKGIDLQSLSGIKFDMTGFLKDTAAAKADEVNDILNFSDKKNKKGKNLVAKPAVKQCCVTSASESEDSDASGSDYSDDEVEVLEVRGKKPKGKFKSGLYARPGDAKLVSNEWHAHVALDEITGGDRDLDKLSFNLLEAG